MSNRLLPWVSSRRCRDLDRAGRPACRQMTAAFGNCSRRSRRVWAWDCPLNAFDPNGGCLDRLRSQGGKHCARHLTVAVQQAIRFCDEVIRLRSSVEPQHASLRAGQRSQDQRSYEASVGRNAVYSRHSRLRLSCPTGVRYERVSTMAHARREQYASFAAPARCTQGDYWA